jgi:hypothetical protein
VPETRSKIVTVRLDFETHRRAAIKLAETGGSFQEILTSALVAWLEGRDSGRAAERKNAPDRQHHEEHELLDLILDAGGDAATTVRTMLYALAPQARAGRRKQTKAG